MQVPDKPFTKATSIRGLSTTQALLRILKDEGPVALYRGFIPTLAMSLPGTVIYFVAYERIRDGLRETPLLPVVPLLSGAMARVFAATAVSPIELLRTRMQYHGREHGRLPVIVRGLRLEFQQHGFGLIWRGLSPTLWRDVPFSAIYWTILEALNGRDAKRTPGAVFVNGAIAGATAAIITTPFDVAKTRRQVISNHTASTSMPAADPPSSVWKALRVIYRQEGWAGLMQGVVPRVGKVAPACAIMIGSYEFGKSFVRSHISVE